MQTFGGVTADQHYLLWCGDCGQTTRFFDTGLVLVSEEPLHAVERGAPERSYITDRKLTVWDVLFPRKQVGSHDQVK